MSNAIGWANYLWLYPVVHAKMGSTNEDSLYEELVTVCRTAIGDDLRSVTVFTESDHEQLYLRDDLERDADLDRFVADERGGFRSRRTYGDTELGDYGFTIRAFEAGYLTRIVRGDRGVFVTTDPLNLNEFHEVATAVGTVLEEHAR